MQVDFIMVPETKIASSNHRNKHIPNRVLRFLLLIPAALVLCGATIAQPPATATYTQIGASAGSAFAYADHRDWNNALTAAKNSSNKTLLKLITWRYLLDGDSGASFAEITGFMKANPGWPEQKKLQLRAEMAMRDAHLRANDVVTWFNGAEPLSGIGKLALAEALIQQQGMTDETNRLIREAWHNGDFDTQTENAFLNSYGNLLHQEDHIERTDRLLWEERTAEAKRMLPHLPANYQNLYNARMALIADKKNASSLVSHVEGKLKNDPGLIFDRMRYRARRDDSKGVREMLLAAPATVPYSEKWWPFRELQIRKSVDEGNYALAGKLLSHHSQKDGSELADAKFLDGWIKLEFTHNPQEAYDVFKEMYDLVHYPVSKARAAYWAGRAADQAGSGEAGEWYGKAAQWPTTFYGQLALLKTDGTAPLHLPSEPGSGSFENGEVADAIRICADNDENDLANRMISYLIEEANSDDQIIAAAKFGAQIGKPSLSVRAAKKAFQHNITLIDVSYPRTGPHDLPIERPLALAVTRQESEFDPHARSPSGALGMMQLLPGTAKETARKIGMSYNRNDLSDPDYNMTLGSSYLNRLIDGYSGSYIMAIAAYNAGPGNVHNWAEEFGTPGNDIEHAIDWIEKIPFVETRNYVQRVLENLQVYRHLESDGDAKLALSEDLVR